MNIDHLIKPDFSDNETVCNNRNFDLLAYLDPTTQEILRQFQELQKANFDLSSNQKTFIESYIKNFENCANEEMRRANELVIEHTQHRIGLENQEKIIEQLSIQNAQLSEQNELLKKKLEHLENLPNIDTNLNKIALQAEKPQEVPDYVNDAIKDNELTYDWRVTKSVKSLAQYFIYTVGITDITPYFLAQFKNKDGTPIPINSAQTAIKRAKEE